MRGVTNHLFQRRSHMMRVSKLLLALLCVSAVTFGTYKVVLSHCEIPCGIYGDTTRIDLLYEDVATIEKSMAQIVALSAAKPVNANQLIRWVGNKEEHANKVQHVVTQYFMTQRVKSKATGAKGYDKYVTQLTTLHGMLIHAMKAKQTTDVEHCKHLRSLIDQFAAAYLSPEDLEHVRKAHGKHG